MVPWTRNKMMKVAAAAVVGVVVVMVLVRTLSPHPLHIAPGLPITHHPRHVPSPESPLAGSRPAAGGKESNVTMKTVLMHSFPDYFELQSGTWHFSKCSSRCTLTRDPRLLDDVDLVMVYSHMAVSLPHQRPPHQMWVFFAVESPVNSRNALLQRPPWRSAFNWTMTYRRDSDFYHGYGDFVRATPPSAPRTDLSRVVSGKSKMAAWFVSNCHSHSRREEFVEALQTFFQVDVYGRCGSLTCDKQENCMSMLSERYFFYLSLENSLCTDYITEKVYHVMEMADVVPVVRGGANYTALLPPNSFIDASQFPTVSILARYLKQVSEDRQLYQQYLAWKEHWWVIETYPLHFCDLCDHLHHTDRWAHTYPDIDSWWSHNQCHDSPPVIRG